MYYLLFLLLLPTVVLAHPGIGIVKDSKGNIYYTDLKQVWKISPDGSKSLAVPGVHTHELYIDAKDDLYGEHLWYNGERLNTWGHYVWCLGHNGKLDTIIKPTEGFLQDYSFTRDEKGAMYWVEHFTISRFKKKTPEGLVTTVAEGKFKDVRWIHVTKNGILYFIDLTDLYKINTAGKVLLVAKNIAQSSSSFNSYSGRHSLFGIWTDKKDNMYVANFSGQAVKKISTDGSIKNAVYSTTPWSPTGGLFDDDGNLWLLEASLSNDVRVRKISATQFNEGKTDSVLFHTYAVPAVMATALLSSIILLAKWVLNKRKPQPA
jgi:hypothetical protein